MSTISGRRRLLAVLSLTVVAGAPLSAHAIFLGRARTGPATFTTLALPEECSAAGFRFGAGIIVGTPQADTFGPFIHPQIVFGLGGDDVLYGGQQDDCLVGGDGDDEIYGQDGKDVLIGDSGGDDLDGGNGKDVIVGGEGDDDIDGGNGKDVLIGGAGIDEVDGGSGVDECEGEELKECP